jgi:hypothetical protein
MTFHPGSRVRLSPRAAARFPEPTLQHHVARVICQTHCLPRKELYESWEVARRARRRFRGGRVVDLCCGHALVAHLMLILDDTSCQALAVDRRIPGSARKIARAMVEAWPRLAGRIQLVERSISDVELTADDVVVSAHACGGLTDQIIDRATRAGSRLVLLPCCQDGKRGDRGGLGGWIDPALAIDVTRVARLRSLGYRVVTQRIPDAITEKNRLLLADRGDPAPSAGPAPRI